MSSSKEMLYDQCCEQEKFLVEQEHVNFEIVPDTHLSDQGLCSAIRGEDGQKEVCNSPTEFEDEVNPSIKSLQSQKRRRSCFLASALLVIFIVGAVVVGTLATAFDHTSSKKATNSSSSNHGVDATFSNASTFVICTKQATVTAQIPEDISNEQLGAFYTDRYHEVIRINPLVRDVDVIETVQSLRPDLEIAERLYQDVIEPGAWVTYQVREKLPYYGAIKFICVRKLAQDGCVAICQVPFKLRMIFRTHIKTDETGKRVLEETCNFTGIRLLMGVIIPQWRQVHVEAFARTFELLRAENRWAKQLELEGSEH
jgi:hypothetical protein